MQNNVFLSWLQENFLRISTKSPKFFVVWQWIFGLVMAVSGLPSFLNFILTPFHITLPTAFTVLENKALVISGAVGFFMSLMPAQGTIAKTTDTGVPLKTTDPEKLPFTNAEEKKTVASKATTVAILLLLMSTVCFSQSSFQPLPKLSSPSFRGPHTATTAVHDSTMTAFRFIANIAAYSEPSNLLMAGVGYGFQSLKYDYSNAKWNCQWSVSAVGFAGGSVAPTTPSSVVSVGIMGGILNNLLMAGPIYNLGTKQFGLAVSVGISLNN